MVFGDAAGAVSQMIQEHRYRPGTSHGVSLRLRRTRVKRSLGRDRERPVLRSNWSSTSISSRVIGLPQTTQGRPLPAASNMRSERRDGNFPPRIASRACSRRIGSSDIFGRRLVRSSPESNASDYVGRTERVTVKRG